MTRPIDLLKDEGNCDKRVPGSIEFSMIMTTNPTLTARDMYSSQCRDWYNGNGPVNEYWF